MGFVSAVPVVFQATLPGIAGLSLLDLIRDASGVVQAVIGLLVLTSILSWAVILFKWRELSSAAKDSEDFLEVYQHNSWSRAWQAARELERAPLAVIFLAAQAGRMRIARQRDAAAAATATATLSQSERRVLARQIAWAASREVLRLESRLGFLATTGSAAPFVGLFGTVVGIVNAFTGIGATGQASLAVVAPGIAEALIATAIGLFAAIPAVVFYNLFVARLRDIGALIERFSAEVEEDASALAPAQEAER